MRCIALCRTATKASAIQNILAAELLEPPPRVVAAAEAAVRVVGDEDRCLAVLSPASIEFFGSFPGRVLPGERIDEPAGVLQSSVAAGKGPA